MCYSVESSAKTTLMSFVAIIVLLNSKVTHFQWLGVVLIGWCMMQFAEVLIWLANTKKKCTFTNKVITIALIPLILCLQGICPVIGSFFVKPWNQCDEPRRLFIVTYSVALTLLMLIYFYGNPVKYCTTVTKTGHLDWFVSEWNILEFGIKRLFATTVWQIIIIIPFIVLWDVSYKAVIAFCVLPLIGYFYGFTTDSNGSIWCHYASFASIVSIIMYGLYNFNVYNVFK